MHRREADVPTNCDLDWRDMRETGAPARRCDRCTKLVHDLSAMPDDEARALVRSGDVCVRYVHDANGRIVRGPLPAGARIVPASRLVSRSARRAWMAVASIAAATVFLEACGSSAPVPEPGSNDASTDGHVTADAQVHPGPDGSAGDGG